MFLQISITILANYLNTYLEQYNHVSQSAKPKLTKLCLKIELPFYTKQHQTSNTQNSYTPAPNSSS